VVSAEDAKKKIPVQELSEQKVDMGKDTDHLNKIYIHESVVNQLLGSFSEQALTTGFEPLLI